MWGRSWIASTIVVAVVAAGCGGNDDAAEPDDAATATLAPPEEDTPTPAPEPEPTAITGIEVGPEGGSVTSDDGAFVLDIPPGALAEPATISIGVVPPAELGLVGVPLVGEVYELQPTGLELAVPAAAARTVPALALGLAADEVPFVHVFHGDEEGWTVLGSVTSRDPVDDAVVVETELDRFSWQFAVPTSHVFGDEIALTMSPASFSAPTGDERAVSLSVTGESEFFLSANRSVELEHDGALSSFEGSPESAVATCGDAPGPGTYTAQVRAVVVDDSPEVNFLLGVGFGELRTASDTELTVAAIGSAECTGAPSSGASLAESLAGLWQGTVRLVPVPGGPGGAGYDLTLELDVALGAEGDRFRVTTLQLPSQQPTEGPIDGATGLFVTSGGDGQSYFESYVGVPIPSGEGTFTLVVCTFGGPTELEEQAPAIWSDVFGVVIEPGGAVELDPALAAVIDDLQDDDTTDPHSLVDPDADPGPFPLTWFLCGSAELGER